MFVGHLAVGLAAKRVAPKVSLGTLLLAATFPDVLWSLFLLIGFEHVRIKPGITPVNPLDLYDFPLSHSLLMDAMWAALIAGSYFLWKKSSRGAFVLFFAVISHWVLDFVSHRPDMPLTPWSHTYFGLGLWNSVRATLLVEGLLWCAGIVVYIRATRAKHWVGVVAFWAIVLLLTFAWIADLGSVQPPSLRALEIVNVISMAILLAWGYWIDTLRPPSLMLA